MKRNIVEPKSTDLKENKNAFKTKRKILDSIAFTLFSYVLIFVGISFILTCSIILFLKGSNLSEDFIRQRAPATFSNIFILSFIFTFVAMAAKYYFFDKPLKNIQAAMKNILKGNYSFRLLINEKLENQEMMVELFENLNKIASHLEKAEEKQLDFVSNVSHEIKTPLTVIKNYVHLLEKEDLPMDERKKYHTIIEENAEKLNSLVSNVLKLNKLENQVIVKECEVFDFSELVCESLLSFEATWTEKNIEIETNLEEGISINTDKTLLEIVCNNLISNAMKFTEPNGKVIVECYQKDNIASVSVTDSGCGISSETGKHIFDKFYQGDTSRKSEGNGLGLALVKRIIDVLGGEIFVQSQLGKGSKFTVNLEVTK
jgi:signal transduction histidine kinase